MLGRAVRSELRKFFTTRLWWGMAIAVVLAGAAFSALNAYFLTSAEIVDQMARSGVPPMSDLDRARSVYTSGVSVAYVLTLAIGVLTVGAEYRHQTITSTFLATPNRVRVMTAKVISLLGLGVGYGLLSLVASVGLGAVVLAARGAAAFPGGFELWRSLLLALLVLGLWGLIGLGLGILVPNQVAALMIGVGVVFVVEPLVGYLLGQVAWGRSIVPWLPGSATNAVLGNVSGNALVTPWSWWTAALLLIGYAAVMAGVGTWLTTRRDVS